ncbi:MBL fold metallo-hydrolase [Alicyclobacillus sp. SO9]|uniref:MBL fold metallo-hydrolase n=1 Tax=Alicyclobacillus sp. SO9 TaxID=2665646 RepID=UPI0018E888B0|nr:MBL fold metallo-hydrolase [Alicyclobacillus sp. SO9]QQE78324.1 MBL fold metallo-hydrolase [Alicyclobacillus sp. SO9]
MKPKIVQIPILPLNMVNAYLILNSQGCILVDTGFPGSETKIRKMLSRFGLSFKDINLIIITHAHVDHAGSAALLRELSGAPIVAHADDRKYFNGSARMAFCPTGFSGRAFLKTGLPLKPYVEFEPDILLSTDDTLDTSHYGVPGLLRHTTGHTAGSISLELSTHDALVGDLVASGILIGGMIRTKHAIRPPFEDNPRAVGLSLQRLLDSGTTCFFMGHGAPLGSMEVQRHAKALMMAKPQISV